MRNRMIVSILALAGVVGLAALLASSATQAQGRGQQGQRGAQPEVRITGANNGNTDHTAAVPSIAPPPGWKACPRCQNATDREVANKAAKVEGHAFNPRDFSGVWGFNGTGQLGKAPPMTPWGEQQHAATIGAKNADGEPLHTKDTSGRGGGAQINCDPPGWPRLHNYNYGVEFVMLPDRVLQFFELPHTWRTIWTDGRKLPDNPPEPHWLGWTIGHWEGNVLVVESNGYDDRPWIDASRPDGGYTHSDEMRVTERWQRLDYGTLQSQITIHDPKTYTADWVGPVSKTVLVPGAELWENFCAPSDYQEFNNEVFLPTSAGAKK